jgi:2-polyprenyl-3-methyl-5-hydroxy-6-metoxy-1,4-benzoquinol methylase
VICPDTRPPGYETKVERVEVVGGDALDIRSLLDRRQYADPEGLAEAAGISPASWPLFGQLWPCARILADTMQAWHLGASRILEIGCGLAIASLVVHRRHGDITASDRHPLVASFIADNLHRNRLPPMKYATGNWVGLNSGLGEFDLIIGSDVLYERDHPAMVAGFIRRHAAPHAEIVLVDPERGNRANFTHRLWQLDFELAERKACVSLADGTAHRGSLLRYRR